MASICGMTVGGHSAGSNCEISIMAILAFLAIMAISQAAC